MANDPLMAGWAMSAGIDRVMVDIEQWGKQQRQHGQGLHFTDHRIADLAVLRPVVPPGRLMVRVDPLHPGTAEQVGEVLARGADRLMLPYFSGADEVRSFLAIVAGRRPVTLLVETAGALAAIAELAALPGVDELHLGLNDLRLSCGGATILDPLVDGRAAAASAVVRAAGRRFGVGGIGALDRGDLPVPADLVLAAQVDLGCGLGLLGRSFRGAIPRDPAAWRAAVDALRGMIARCRADRDGRPLRQRRLAAAVADWIGAVRA